MIAICAGLNNLANDIKAHAGQWPSDDTIRRVQMLQMAAALLQQIDGELRDARKQVAELGEMLKESSE